MNANVTTTETIDVVIVDDEKFVRGALRTYLSQVPDIMVVAEGENGADAVRLAHEIRPQVMLIDIQMPVMDGITAIRQIVADMPEIRILVVTGHISDIYLKAALIAGASGYVVKDAEPERIVTAVREVHAGDCPIDPAVTHVLVDDIRKTLPEVRQAAGVELSDREEDVLKLLCEGRSNSEIASALYLSESTVKYHLVRLGRKFSARDRLQLVITALRTGVVD
ncbi:response regulator transcription factor [Arthrobacter sp. H35-D1]|uniref:response regulator n=1 Tax=Arthrobacter sp. H35-D1 TaxID=3046202 RepID=UPI0024B95763|nr:response regulator transcription factor [Arthrobacter sp. H35-D1]MDJ0312162.1 response regulator transcription factor [Arthrobacter sp. H35-D1]